MTGRRLGNCAGSDEPGFMNDDMTPRGGKWLGRGPGWGNGLGYRRGYGRGHGYGFGPGRRRGFDPAPAWTSPEAHADEQQPLAEQVAMLKKQIAALEAQIAAANDHDV